MSNCPGYPDWYKPNCRIQPKEVLGLPNAYIIDRDRSYVVVHLSGRMGNQLFEIAAGYAFALEYNYCLWVTTLHDHRDTIFRHFQFIEYPNIAHKVLLGHPRIAGQSGSAFGAYVVVVLGRAWEGIQSGCC
jgi:hypothetical protein